MKPLKIATSCLIVPFLMLCQCSSEPGPSSKAADEEAIKVSWAEVDRKSISVSEALVGRVRPHKIAEIRPQVDGIIQDRLFKEGAYVEEGEQLYQIDPARYEAAFKAAKGRLARARSSYKATQSLVRRYKTLVKQNAISQQELDDTLAKFGEIQASMQIAQAEVQQAEINLKYTKVLAPISGYIGKSEVTKGALVSSQQSQKLATIRSLDPVYVDISQPLKEVLSWREQSDGAFDLKSKKTDGLTVSIKIEGSDRFYDRKGKLEVAELAVNEESGSIDLRAVVPNPDLVLLPGMFVNAYIEELGKTKKLLVPQRAITRKANGQAWVWVIDKKNRVSEKRVQTGGLRNDFWVVESGLSQGERVALDNLFNLKDGVLVEPVSEDHTTPKKQGEIKEKLKPKKAQKESRVFPANHRVVV